MATTTVQGGQVAGSELGALGAPALQGYREKAGPMNREGNSMLHRGGAAPLELPEINIHWVLHVRTVQTAAGPEI